MNSSLFTEEKSLCTFIYFILYMSQLESSFIQFAVK